MTRMENKIQRRGEIIRFLRSNPKASCAQVAKAMNVSMRTAQRDLSELKKAGLIRSKKAYEIPLEIIDIALEMASYEGLNKTDEYLCEKYHCTYEAVVRFRQLLEAGQQRIRAKNEISEEEIQFRQGQLNNKECSSLKVLEGYEGISLPFDMWRRYLEIREYKRVGKNWKAERALAIS